MAIDAFLFIAGSCIKHRSVGEHRASLIGNIQYVSMAFLTLVVVKRRIRFLPLALMIILGRVLGEMNEDVLYSMECFGIKKFEGIVRCWQVTVHTVGDEALRIVHVSGRLPGIIGKLDLMAGGAKLRRRCSNHGVVADAEQREGDDDPHQNQ